MYTAAVPETWSLINDRDIIPHVAKFLDAYKRPGQRVIFDRRGSLIVRPSPLEVHVRPGEAPEPPGAPSLSACSMAKWVLTDQCARSGELTGTRSAFSCMHPWQAVFS